MGKLKIKRYKVYRMKDMLIKLYLVSCGTFHAVLLKEKNSVPLDLGGQRYAVRRIVYRLCTA